MTAFGFGDNQDYWSKRFDSCDSSIKKLKVYLKQKSEFGNGEIWNTSTQNFSNFFNVITINLKNVLTAHNFWIKFC